MELDDSGTITVRASGAAGTTPDVVTVLLGVDTAAANPGEALRSATSAAVQLDRLCDEQGVERSARQTSQVSVTGVFDHQRQRMSHHQATYAVRVEVADVDVAAALVDAAAREPALAEVLRIDGILFSCRDLVPAQSTARARAVAAARRSAEELAAAAGVSIGAVRSIVEGQAGQRGFGDLRLAAETAPAMPLQPGSTDVHVDVVVTFDIVT